MKDRTVNQIQELEMKITKWDMRNKLGEINRLDFAEQVCEL
jgi:hypothetical protein